jgi:hypothetical protein
MEFALQIITVDSTVTMRRRKSYIPHNTGSKDGYDAQNGFASEVKNEQDLYLLSPQAPPWRVALLCWSVSFETLLK